MKDLKQILRNIFRKRGNSGSGAEKARTNDINEITNAVFEKYEKCFKDLARHDREGKFGVN